MPKAPTERQQQVFHFLVSFIEQHGYPPTLREMMEGLEIGSLRGVSVHLEALQKKGWIERDASSGGRSARGIRIPARITSHAQDSSAGIARLPLLGAIAAGAPLLAAENIEDILPVPTALLRGAPDAFLLRVRGESMTGAHILPGDLAIIQPRDHAENGEIVAARIGDEATIKKFQRDGDQIALLPQNINYAPLLLKPGDDAAIIGRMIGLLRGAESA